MAIEVHKVEILSVSDGSGLERLIEDGAFGADEVIAVIGKTEGNGGVNDFTRILSDQAFRGVLADRGTRSLEEIDQIPMAWSGGCDGVITPHATVFARVADDRGSAPTPGDKRMTVGIAMSDVLLPEDIGRPAMVEKGRGGVCAGRWLPPASRTWLTCTTCRRRRRCSCRRRSRTRMRAERPSTPRTPSTRWTSPTAPLPSASRSRAWRDRRRPERGGDRACDHSLYSSVASCSSGVELDRAQIVLVGNTEGSHSRYRVGHGKMEDALDQDGIWAAIRSTGLKLPERPHHTDLRGRLVNVFLKCEADPRGQLRGRRQLPLDDSDVHHHRQIKGAVGGVTAATVGDSAVFVSVAALHQGPLGGGPVAAIVRVD